MDYDYYIGLLESTLGIEFYAEEAELITEYLKENLDEIIHEFISIQDDSFYYMKPEKKEKLVDEAVIDDLIIYYNKNIKEN